MYPTLSRAVPHCGTSWRFTRLNSLTAQSCVISTDVAVPEAVDRPHDAALRSDGGDAREDGDENQHARVAIELLSFELLSLTPQQLNRSTAVVRHHPTGTPPSRGSLAPSRVPSGAMAIPSASPRDTGFSLNL
jgi:hypothetical protein